MESFYTSPEDIRNGSLALTGEEAHHCARVSRCVEGDDILVIDGCGTAYRSTITDISRERVECSILETLPGMNELRRQIYLAISLLKHSPKFDILVEKATELGVSKIIPLLTARSQRSSVNLQRLQQIALSATKQSLRCRIPEVLEPVPLRQVLETVNAEASVLAHEKAHIEQSFVSFLSKKNNLRSLLILIGPEGGFTDAECNEAETLGAEIISLGARRLRTETAAILAVGLAAQET